MTPEEMLKSMTGNLDPKAVKNMTDIGKMFAQPVSKPVEIDSVIFLPPNDKQIALLQKVGGEKTKVIFHSRVEIILNRDYKSVYQELCPK